MEPVSICWCSGAGLGPAACIPWEQLSSIAQSLDGLNNTLRVLPSKEHLQGPFLGLSDRMTPSLAVMYPLSLSTTPRAKPVEIHPTYVASGEGWLPAPPAAGQAAAEGPALLSRAHPEPHIPLDVVYWSPLRV